MDQAPQAGGPGPDRFDLAEHVDQRLSVLAAPIKLGDGLGRFAQQIDGKVLTVSLDEQTIGQGEIAGIKVLLARRPDYRPA